MGNKMGVNRSKRIKEEKKREKKWETGKYV